MVKKRLGNSSITISTLGMGCWAYGGGKYWGAQNQKDVDEVVHAALDQCINYFDTAEVYNDGESEVSLGLALQGRRSEAVIGTKVSTSNTKPAVLREHCEASLKRLKTDYIDIYMLHWPLNPKAVEHFTDDSDLISSPPTVQEVFETMTKLQKEGKIRYIGISNHGIQQMEEIRKTGTDIVVNELPYNLISRGIEDGIVQYCIEKNIGVFGYMAMQQGILAGIYPAIEAIPPAQAHSRHFHFSRGGQESRHGEEGAEEEIFYLLKGMQKIANDLGINIPTLSLSWAMEGNGISCTLVGSRTLNELTMNINTASYKLPDDAYKKLDELSKPVLQKLGTNPDYYENRKNSRIF